MITKSITLDTRVGAANIFSVSHINSSIICGNVAFNSVDNGSLLSCDRMQMTVHITASDKATMNNYSKRYPDGIFYYFKGTEDNLYITLVWEYLLIELCRINERIPYQHISIRKIITI
jgi:hypothetical protein